MLLLLFLLFLQHSIQKKSSPFYSYKIRDILFFVIISVSRTIFTLIYFSTVIHSYFNEIIYRYI